MTVLLFILPGCHELLCLLMRDTYENNESSLQNNSVPWAPGTRELLGMVLCPELSRSFFHTSGESTYPRSLVPAPYRVSMASACTGTTEGLSPSTCSTVQGTCIFRVMYLIEPVFTKIEKALRIISD